MGSRAIKVDTEQIRSLSKCYRIRADGADESGKTVQYGIRNTLSHMPDYDDGQLQRAANMDAMDLYIRNQSFHTAFREDSDSLIQTAEAFEIVDGQTIKIFEENDGIVSRASIVDETGTDQNISTCQKVIKNPDGSVTTVTVVTITYPDGTKKEIVTMQTVWHFDASNADLWNEREGAVGEFLASTLMSTLAMPLELGLAAETLLHLSTDCAFKLSPYDKYADGDTVIYTSTIETTYLPDGTPVLQDIKNHTEVIDANGEKKFEDTTGT